MLSLKLSLFLAVAIASTTVLSEPVNFQPCPADVDSCTVTNVNIDPCPEALKSMACNIPRRKKTKMTFDITPHFDADTLESALYWVKDSDNDLPLMSMERDACKATKCPVESGVKQTYSIDIPIEAKFPTSSYTIKWILKENSGKRCCFTTDIKVVR